MPITLKYCKGFCDLNSIFRELGIREDGNWLFRGERNAKYSLSPSIERIVPDPGNFNPIVELALINELANLGKKFMAANALDDLDNLMNWYAEMQHYGGPSRLLDWTYGLKIAFYFALERSVGNEPFAIYATRKSDFETLKDVINSPKIVQDFPWPDELSEGGKFFTALEQGVFFYELPDGHSNKRLQNQKGVFLVQGQVSGYEFSTNLDNSRFGKQPEIFKFIVSANCISKAAKRYQLYCAGVTKKIIYPDNDLPYASDLKDFVRKTLKQIYPD